MPKACSSPWWIIRPSPPPRSMRCSAAPRRAGPLVRVPRYRGRRGHPIWFSRDLIPEFLALPADGAARDVVRAHAAQTEFLDVDDPGILADIDDPAAYARLTGAARMKLRLGLLFKILGVAAAAAADRRIRGALRSPPTSTAAACRPRSSARSGAAWKSARCTSASSKAPASRWTTSSSTKTPRSASSRSPTSGARLHGSRAQHLVAARRALRDRLHPPG